MPSVGFGTWKIPQPECEDIVYKAIKNGYRCIDEADVYCNQKEAGLGINKAISEGIVSREDIWVTSKLWNTYHRKEHVMPACKKTLKDLGLDYVDLYLIHFPIASKYYDMDKFQADNFSMGGSKVIEEDHGVTIRETWMAMEELVKAGLVKNIGVSNFNIQLIRDILTYCTIKPAIL